MQTIHSFSLFSLSDYEFINTEGAVIHVERAHDRAENIQNETRSYSVCIGTGPHRLCRGI